MAFIQFYVRSKKNPSKINLRFHIDRKNDFRKVIPIYINPDYFNNNKGKVRNISHFKDKLNIQKKLDDLETYLFQSFNNSSANGEATDKHWFKQIVKDYFNPEPSQNSRKKDKGENLFENHTQKFINELDLKTNDRTGEVGVSKASKSKYLTIDKKVREFQEYKGKKFKLTDINLEFRDEFLKYLLEVDKLSKNTAGRYLVFVKTICRNARSKGLKVSNDLDSFKGFKVKAKKIYLKPEELEMIWNCRIDSKRLDSARDWLVLGCYLGQRAGDLLALSKENIEERDGKKFIYLTQQKTSKRVTVPIHKEAQKVINKNKGDFPAGYAKKKQSSLTLFNRYIKKVCREAGLNEKVEGSKMNPATGRKEEGVFEKWKLITSHICRRSFATNFYGEIPTPYLINVTGHSSEKEFLNYIGKSSFDYAEQLAEIWN